MSGQNLPVKTDSLSMLLLYCLFPDSGCPKAEEETIFVIREQRSPHDGTYIIYLHYTAIHMLFKRYDRKNGQIISIL